MPAGDSNSIESRNRKAARDSEARLWHALCDDASAVLEQQHTEPDCVVVNPLIHPDRSAAALSAHSEPSLADALGRLARSRNRWTSYRMHARDPEPAIAQVEMMSVQIMYKLTLIRERHPHGSGGGDEGKDKTLETVDAFCSSTWRQGAGGDWKLCAQMLVPVQ